MIKPLHLYMAGGAVALLGLMLLLKKGTAQNLGNAAGGAVAGAAVGLVAGINDALGIPRTSDVINAAGGAVDKVVAAANNPDVNPLQPFGSWLGGAIFDVFHPAAAKP